MQLSVPNERRQSMTALELVLPPGVVIVEAASGDGWMSESTPQRARWSGGELPTFAATSFAVRLDIDHEPGNVVLRLVERYADGSRVRWPVTLVVSSRDDPSSRLVLVLLLGLVALLGLTIGGALLWRRRSGLLQEK